MVLGGGRNEIPVFQLHDDFMPWTLMIVRHIFFNVFFIHTMERFVHIMMPAAHLHLYMWIKFWSNLVWTSTCHLHMESDTYTRIIDTAAAISGVPMTIAPLLLCFPCRAASIAITMHDVLQNWVLVPLERHISTLSLDNHQDHKTILYLDRLIFSAPGALEPRLTCL